MPHIGTNADALLAMSFESHEGEFIEKDSVNNENTSLLCPIDDIEERTSHCAPLDLEDDDIKFLSEVEAFDLLPTTHAPNSHTISKNLASLMTLMKKRKEVIFLY